MTYLDHYNLSVNGTFRVRLAAAFIKYAKGVVAEDPATPLHAERFLQAAKTINYPQMWADRLAFAAAVALDVAEPTDAQLDTLTAQFWDVLAIAPQV